MNKQKIYTEDDALLLMEVAGLLSFYFSHFIYMQGNSVDKTSSIINSWAEEFFRTYGHMENINLIGEQPYNYGFSGECWSFTDAVKEFGERKFGYKIDISKREYEKLKDYQSWWDSYQEKIKKSKNERKFKI